MKRRHRKTYIGQAMSLKSAVTLLDLARERYGKDKVRLAVLICPVAVEHVVDNARDAAETIRRLRVRNEIVNGSVDAEGERP